MNGDNDSYFLQNYDMNTIFDYLTNNNFTNIALQFDENILSININ